MIAAKATAILTTWPPPSPTRPSNFTNLAWLKSSITNFEKQDCDMQLVMLGVFRLVSTEGPKIASKQDQEWKAGDKR